jgi:UDP-N-acetylglucosamine--dolichyl-phosphate N-acetylglucosaminephosphotransferase
MIQIFLIVLALFLFSIILVFLVIKRNFSKKILGNDVNKKSQPLVAESTGIALLIPFWIMILLSSILFYFDIKLFFVGIAVTIFLTIGFFDDNKHKFLSKAIGWKVRALPLALTSIFIAGILFFPQNILGIFLVILLALFFAGLASLSNTFEGLNAWTVGSSFIISIFSSIMASQFNTSLSFLFLFLSSIILALLIFNKYPAKAFPGDSGTLFIGSAIAGLALLSQNIFFIIFIFLLFIPHMIDFFVLKMITNRKDASQMKQRPYKLLSNGRLTIPKYRGRTKYDFAKLIMKIFGPLYEWQIVSIIWLIVIINSLIWTSLFILLF